MVLGGGRRPWQGSSHRILNVLPAEQAQHPKRLHNGAVAMLDCDVDIGMYRLLP